MDEAAQGSAGESHAPLQTCLTRFRSQSARMHRSGNWIRGTPRSLAICRPQTSTSSSFATRSIRSARRSYGRSRNDCSSARRRSNRPKVLLSPSSGTDWREVGQIVISVVLYLIRLGTEQQAGVLINSMTINSLFCAIWKAQDELVDSTTAIYAHSPPSERDLAEECHSRPELPKLSSTQIEANCVWKPANEALLDTKIFVEQCRGCDVSQGNVSDCSLVSALIVGIEHHAKFGSKVSRSFYRAVKRC